MAHIANELPGFIPIFDTEGYKLLFIGNDQPYLNIKSRLKSSDLIFSLVIN